MKRAINLLNYLPDFMREYKEMKNIADAETPEFSHLADISETVLNNQFIASCNETGIARFEKILKITPAAEDTIESRRLRVQSRWLNTIPYTMRALGLYAVDSDEGEILYAVTIDTSGNCYMPPYNNLTVSGAHIRLVTTVGNSDNVSLQVNPAAFATVEQVKQMIAESTISTANMEIGDTEPDKCGSFWFDTSERIKPEKILRVNMNLVSDSSKEIKAKVNDTLYGVENAGTGKDSELSLTIF